MRTTTTATFALVLTLAAASSARAVSLIGIGTIAGSAPDQSGLTGTVQLGDGSGPVPQGTPNNAFGGAGSGIDYTGANNLYIMSPDRGPNDGNAQYADRVQYVQIVVDENAGTVTPTNTATVLLTNGGGQQLTGSAAASGGAVPLRFDPEAIRVSANGDGSYWISDEYGPYVRKFNAQGQQIGEFAVPAKYAIANPSTVANDELLNNTMGRQSNRGMEGLAISPSGNTLYGLMQNALIQDHALNGTTRVSTNTRILQMDITSGTTKEFVYQINSAGSGIGVNEILAVNDHQFLVVERDNRVGVANRLAAIYLIDTTNATDISTDPNLSGTTALNGLPQTGLPAGVNAVTKTLLINLTSFISSSQLPEKIEGLAWGPNLSNGDRLLIVTTDNDFVTSNPNYFYAFRVTGADLVPEPASLGLFAIGALGLVARRRRS